VAEPGVVRIATPGSARCPDYALLRIRTAPSSIPRYSSQLQNNRSVSPLAGERNKLTDL
jgi:hypothetical protein